MPGETALSAGQGADTFLDVVALAARCRAAMLRLRFAWIAALVVRALTSDSGLAHDIGHFGLVINGSKVSKRLYSWFIWHSEYLRVYVLVHLLDVLLVRYEVQVLRPQLDPARVGVVQSLKKIQTHEASVLVG